MNAKKVKILRRKFRHLPAETLYDAGKPQHRTNSLTKWPFVITGTIRLAAGSRRFALQQAKRS